MARTVLLVFAVAPLGLTAQMAPDGPDAPDMDASWSNAYTLTLTDPLGSNNYGQNYQELIPELDGSPDPFWRFQGYLIFQVVPDFNPYMQNCFDPDLARLIGQSDNADGIIGITGARHVHVEDDLGAVLLDTCFAEQITGVDAGLEFTCTVAMDAFTDQPFDPEATVCFLALAYATNPYEVSDECGGTDAIIISRKASFGALRTVCVNALTSGLSDRADEDQFMLGPVPANETLVWSGAPGTRELRMTNTLGSLVRTVMPTSTTEHIDVSGWPVGWYTMTAVSPNGTSTIRPFLVAR